MSSLIAILEARYREREEKNPSEGVNFFPPIHQIDEPALLGAFAYTLRKSHVRLVYRPTAIDLGYGIVTPGEVARDYLAVKYPRKRRITKKQAIAFDDHRSQPLYARPGRWGECAYIDIKSAYWSILSAVGWDCEYLPDRWLAYGEKPSDFPAQIHKLARNCLVSSCVPSSMHLWTGEKLVIKNTYNPHLNSSLWAVVQDTLHGVASDISKLTPFYVNTDGYIVRDKVIMQALEIIDSWGLPASVKYQGETEVWGVGLYRVGGHITKQEGRRFSTPYNAIRKGNWEWLRNRVQLGSQAT